MTALIPPIVEQNTHTKPTSIIEEVKDNPVIAPKANDGAYKTIDI